MRPLGIIGVIDGMGSCCGRLRSRRATNPILLGVLALSLGILPHAGRAESSPFGLRPDDLGLRLSPYAARERAMGQAGMASISQSASPLNPARSAFHQKTSFTATMVGDLDYLSDAQTSNRLTSFSIPQLAAHFQTGWLGNFGFAYWQRFARDFSFSPLYVNPQTRQSIHYEGGLHELVMSWAYALGRNYALGASYHWILGRERTIRRTEFENLENARDLTGDTLHVRSNGGFPMLSAMYRHRLFNVALSAGAGGSLESRTRRSVTGIAGQDWKEGGRDFPWTLAAGVALKPAHNQTVAADYSVLLYEGPGDAEPRHTAGAGYEWTGTGGVYDPYYTKVSLRWGAGYEYLPLDGADHYYLSLGAGLPLGRRGGILDVSLAYGHRGSAEVNLVVEDYVQLSLTLTGVGTWGQPSRHSR